MSLRTSLIIDGDASGASQAAAQTNAALGKVGAAATQAAQAADRAAKLAEQQVARVARQAAMLRQNVLFQLNDIGVSLASGMNPLMVAIQQGSQLATGPGGLGGALKEIGSIAAGLATKFWPIGAAVGAATAGIAGMQAAINSAGSSVEVSFGDVALGALQSFGDVIWGTIGPAVAAIGEWFAGAWNTSWPIIKDFGNKLVGTFVGAFEATKSIWGTLPEVMGDIVYSAANSILDGLKWLINSTIDRFNDLRHLVGMKDGDFGHVDLFQVVNPYKGAMANAGSKIVESFQGAFQNDYLGDVFTSIAENARQNALNRQKEEASSARAKQQAKSIDLVTSALANQRTAWNELADAGGNAFDRLTDTILSGGKDIVGTLQDIAGELAKSVFQMSITNPLKGFFGNALGSVVGTGGIGGLKASPGLGGLTGSVMSFDGGGSTGTGARSGGLDGKGGFLAMLHPKESVVDHAAGGGGSSQVVRVVLQTDSGLIADIADQRITTASGTIVEVAVERSNRKFHDQAARGSLRPYGVGPALKRS